MNKQIPQHIDPAEEIYDAAQADMKIEMQKLKDDAESREKDCYAKGAINAFKSVQSSTELQKYALLHRVKQEKEYKKGGLTWKAFCEEVGLSVRRVDEILSDIHPLIKQFSADFVDLSGISFNKIRYLGRSISADSAEITPEGIKVDDEEIIPITPEHKEDIEAYIDNLKSAEKKAKQEAKEEIKAKDRVIKTLHKTIADQEKTLSEYTAKDSQGATGAEKEQLKTLREIKAQFDLFYHAMNIDVNSYLADAPNTVQTEYAGIIAYAAKMVDCLRDEAHERLGISIYPEVSLGEPDWEPQDFSHLSNS